MAVVDVTYGTPSDRVGDVEVVDDTDDANVDGHVDDGDLVERSEGDLGGEGAQNRRTVDVVDVLARESMEAADATDKRKLRKPFVVRCWLCWPWRSRWLVVSWPISGLFPMCS